MTSACRFCGVSFEDGLPGRFQHGGGRRWHEKRCARASVDERAYFRTHREWPPSAGQLIRLREQRRRWKKASRERRRVGRVRLPVGASA